VGALLAALNVAYRDFKYTIPFLVQIWMFATPTVYMNVEPHDPPAAETQAQAGQAGGGERAGHPRSGSGSEEQGATSSLTPDTSHLTPGPSGGEGSSQQNLPSTSGRGTRERVPGGEGAGRPVARTAVARGWVKAVLRLNPMTGLIGFFRAAVLGGPLPWARLGTSVAIILAVFVAGLTYFRRVESSFADII
jgi:lipopolysaccharide transport system permease protein